MSSISDIQALPSLDELEALLSETHRRTGLLPYVDDLDAIRKNSFNKGFQSAEKTYHRRNAQWRFMERQFQVFLARANRMMVEISSGAYKLKRLEVQDKGVWREKTDDEKLADAIQTMDRFLRLADECSQTLASQEMAEASQGVQPAPQE